jgi:hypothetical protein
VRAVTSAQVAAFQGEEAFAEMLLGLRSWTGRIVEALALAAPADGTVDPGLVEVLLGVVSFDRTLRANLGIEGCRREDVRPEATNPVSPPTRLLR